MTANQFARKSGSIIKLFIFCTHCFFIINSLHKEIEDFFAYMSATPEEHSMRLDVLERVTNVIHAEWPKAKVEVFGSFRTGLYLPTR